MSRVALELTESLIQRVMGALLQRQSGRGVKLASHLYLVMRLKMREAMPTHPLSVDRDKFRKPV
jgi:hypothetical protein